MLKVLYPARGIVVALLSMTLLNAGAVEDLHQFVQQPATTLRAQPNGVNLYERLPITPDEQQKISKIISTMAENNVFQLLFERKYLERLGQEVHHVHPVRFLGTIFSDPRLVNCMFEIHNSGFKWGGFMDGISARLKEEIKAGNVNSYIPGFAERLNLRFEDVQGYINRRDIEGLVLFLMDKKR